MSARVQVVKRAVGLGTDSFHVASGCRGAQSGKKRLAQKLTLDPDPGHECFSARATLSRPLLIQLPVRVAARAFRQDARPWRGADGISRSGSVRRRKQPKVWPETNKQKKKKTQKTIQHAARRGCRRHLGLCWRGSVGLPDPTCAGSGPLPCVPWQQGPNLACRKTKLP